MKYKAVIFDMDGTLLNTIDDIGDSMNAVLARRGFATHSIDKYKYFVGDGMKNLALRALPETRRTPEFIDEIVVEMEREYSSGWNKKTAPYPGITETLERLTEMGVKMSIFSNKPHKFTIEMAGEYFKEHKFEFVIGASNMFPKKPDPAAAIYIAQKLGIPAGEFIYAGDTNTDMATAKNAKMFAAGVSWGFRPAAELIEAGAEIIIDNPRQLVELFRRG